MTEEKKEQKKEEPRWAKEDHARYCPYCGSREHYCICSSLADYDDD